MSMDAASEKLYEAVESVNKRLSAVASNQADLMRLQGVGIAVGAAVGFVAARKLWRYVTGSEPDDERTLQLQALTGFTSLTRPSKRTTHFGSCACGHVRFTLQAPKKLDVVECFLNCLKGTYQHTIVQASNFKMQSSPQTLAVAFNPHEQSRFLFCMDCGVEVFHFPGYSSGLVAVNAECLGDESKVCARVYRFIGRSWPNAFATVDPAVFVETTASAAAAIAAEARAADGATSSRATTTPLNDLARPAAVRRGAPHPLTATGMVYRSPFNPTRTLKRSIPRSLKVARRSSREDQSSLAKGKRMEDLQYLHALLDLPPPVDYRRHAPLYDQNLRQVSALSTAARARAVPKPVHRAGERVRRDTDAHGSQEATPPLHSGSPSARRRVVARSPFAGGSTPFEPTGALSPYSIRVPAASPYSPSPMLAVRETRSRVARSLKNHHAFAAARSRMAEAAPEVAEPEATMSNSSFDSVSTHASVHSTARGRTLMLAGDEAVAKPRAGKSGRPASRLAGAKALRAAAKANDGSWPPRPPAPPTVAAASASTRDDAGQPASSVSGGQLEQTYGHLRRFLQHHKASDSATA